MLRRGYKKTLPEMAEAIRRLMKSTHVVMNQHAIEEDCEGFVSFEVKTIYRLRSRDTGHDCHPKAENWE